MKCSPKSSDYKAKHDHNLWKRGTDDLLTIIAGILIVNPLI